jgi:hypothetical protein
MGGVVSCSEPEGEGGVLIGRGDNRFGKCGVQQSAFSTSRPRRAAEVVHFDGACLQSDPGSHFDVGVTAGAGLGGLWWRNDCLKGLLSLQAKGAGPIMKIKIKMRPSLINMYRMHDPTEKVGF